MLIRLKILLSVLSKLYFIKPTGHYEAFLPYFWLHDLSILSNTWPLLYSNSPLLVRKSAVWMICHLALLQCFLSIISFGILFNMPLSFTEQSFVWFSITKYDIAMKWNSFLRLGVSLLWHECSRVFTVMGKY